ncbi:MAG: hypothetical protein HQL72_08735 [Magnetococcales bacterium]|nr:hypothetical protein [Magnetococcales bacterium]
MVASIRPLLPFILLFLLLIPLSPKLVLGAEESPPFSDPTLPLASTPTNLKGSVDLFSPESDRALFSSLYWPVEVVKLYQDKPEKSWAIIQGERVGVGSRLFGGKVTALNKSGVTIQLAIEKRFLGFYRCQATKKSQGTLRIVRSDKGCQGLYLAVGNP